MRAAAPCLFSSIRDHSLVFLGRNGLLWNLSGVRVVGECLSLFPNTYKFIQDYELNIPFGVVGLWVVGLPKLLHGIAEQQQEW